MNAKLTRDGLVITITSLVFLVLQLADDRLWDFSASIIT